jgi:hypothetical protein
MGAEPRLPLDRLDDLRVSVPGDHRAVAEMEIDVLVAVDVPDAAALPAVDVDRVWRRILPARRDATGDGSGRDLLVGDGREMLGLELALLVLDQPIDELQIQLDRFPYRHASPPPAI